MFVKDCPRYEACLCALTRIHVGEKSHIISLAVFRRINVAATLHLRRKLWLKMTLRVVMDFIARLFPGSGYNERKKWIQGYFFATIK